MSRKNYDPTAAFIAKLRFDWSAGLDLLCSIWTGSRDQKQYGHFRYGGKVRRAHTVAYEWYLGEPLPPGLQVHHKGCENPACCTVSHLRLLTPRQHFAAHQGPTCKHGHPRIPENQYVYTHRDGFERKACIPCLRARQRAHAAEAAARRRERDAQRRSA